TVSPDQLLHLKELGGIGNGINALQDMMRTYTHPLPPMDFGAMTFDYYYNNYPEDFDDENNLSLVAIIKHGELCIAFPGDLEVAGWERLLQRTDFRSAMSQVNVFVASHHGRENGCSEALYEMTGMKPVFTIISDSGIEYATQETIAWYRQ